jgi:hypothetical protein
MSVVFWIGLHLGGAIGAVVVDDFSDCCLRLHDTKDSSVLSL